MNDVITLSQLITRLARVTDTDINTARRFVRSIFAAVEEQLMAGDSVTVKGIGTFRPNNDALAGESVLFIPDDELAAAVNAPFAMFEPVELAEGVNFEEVTAFEAEDAAEAGKDDTVAAAVLDEPSSELPAEVPEEDAEVPIVSTEVSEPAVKRYLFPEEEEGELPPSEPLRAPERKSNRMWVWILFIVIGGGLFGYLLAFLDSDDYLESTQPEIIDEIPNTDSMAMFEEVAVDELTDSQSVVDAASEEHTDTLEHTSAIVSEAEQNPVAEQPVYDTVTGTNYLAKMARKYYGRGSYWVFIYQANADILDHPDRIKPGTRVLIPSKSSFAEATDAATQKKADRIRAELDKKYKK